jgi:hypothetical protein
VTASSFDRARPLTGTSPELQAAIKSILDERTRELFGPDAPTSRYVGLWMNNGHTPADLFAFLRDEAEQRLAAKAAETGSARDTI